MTRTLTIASGIFTKQTCYRRLQGKREVWLGEYTKPNGQTVLAVAKCWAKNRQGLADATAEYRMFLLCQERGIRVPTLLASDLEQAVLITENISGNTVTPPLTPNQWFTLCQTFAEHHAAGLYQTDCHFNNFLSENIPACSQESVNKSNGSPVIPRLDHRMTGEPLQNKMTSRFVTLDLGSMKAQKAPLPTKIALDNLALLVAQLPITAEHARDNALTLYASCRQLDFNERIQRRFLALVKKKQAKRRHHFMKKIWRSCSQFKLQHHATYTTIYDQQASAPILETLYQNPQQFIKKYSEKTINDTSLRLIKNGKKNQVFEINTSNKAYILKQYQSLNFLSSIKQLFGYNRARKAWHNAHYLQHCGILTAKPIALIQAKHRFSGKNYFLMEKVTGVLLYELQKNNPNDALFQKITHLKTQLLHQLKITKIAHGDLKSVNIIQQKNRLILLDVDSLKVYRFLWRFLPAHAKDQARLQNVDFASSSR